MDGFDFSPLFRSTIGFDRLMRLVDAANRVDAGTSYPPYNIEVTGENAYRLTMAVAGFAPEDLDITVKENALLSPGGKTDEEKSSILHHGFARRAFERRFQLADHIKVTGASLENGLLHVDLSARGPGGDEAPQGRDHRRHHPAADDRDKRPPKRLRQTKRRHKRAAVSLSQDVPERGERRLRRLDRQEMADPRQHARAIAAKRGTSASAAAVGVMRSSPPSSRGSVR